MSDKAIKGLNQSVFLQGLSLKSLTCFLQYFLNPGLISDMNRLRF